MVITVKIWTKLLNVLIYFAKCDNINIKEVFL